MINLERIEQKLLKMKDTSELMMDLAYSALLYNNKEIAEEVYDLEEIVDKLFNKIQYIAVTQTSKRNPDVALTLLRLAGSIEMIGDSARGIADVVLRDIEPHPIVKLSIRESDAIISKIKVQPASNLVNCSLGGIRLASETGMWVIAIRRGNRWIFGPDEHTDLKAGDVMFVRGPLTSEKRVQKLAKGRLRDRLRKKKN